MASHTEYHEDVKKCDTPIDAIKAAVRIEDVAAEYGRFKLIGGGRLLGRCLTIDHEDKTPSMTIYTDTQRFKCFGCGISGDVLDLEEIGGKHVEAYTARQALAQRYGVELPQLSDRCLKWKNKKSEVRDVVAQRLAHVYQRRLTRVYAPLVLIGGETPEEELEALQELATALWPVSLDLAGRRVSGEE